MILTLVARSAANSIASVNEATASLMWPCWACAFASRHVQVYNLAVFQIQPDSRGLQRGRVVGERQSEAAQEVLLSILVVEPDGQSSGLAVANVLDRLEDRRVILVKFWRDSPNQSGRAASQRLHEMFRFGWLKSAAAFRKAIDLDWCGRGRSAGAACNDSSLSTKFPSPPIPPIPVRRQRGRRGSASTSRRNPLMPFISGREHERESVVLGGLLNEDGTIFLEFQFGAVYGLQLDRLQNRPPRPRLRTGRREISRARCNSASAFRSGLLLGQMVLALHRRKFPSQSQLQLRESLGWRLLEESRKRDHQKPCSSEFQDRLPGFITIGVLE